MPKQTVCFLVCAERGSSECLYVDFSKAFDNITCRIPAGKWGQHGQGRCGCRSGWATKLQVLGNRLRSLAAS